MAVSRSFVFFGVLVLALVPGLLVLQYFLSRKNWILGVILPTFVFVAALFLGAVLIWFSALLVLVLVIVILQSRQQKRDAARMNFKELE